MLCAGVITWVYKHLLTLLFLTIVRKIHRKIAEPGQYFTLHSKEKAKVKNEENEADNHVWLIKRLAILQRWIAHPHPCPPHHPQLSPKTQTEERPVNEIMSTSSAYIVMPAFFPFEKTSHPCTRVQGCIVKCFRSPSDSTDTGPRDRPTLACPALAYGPYKNSQSTL